MAEEYIIGNNAQFNDSVEILKDLTLYGVVENTTDFAVKIQGDEKLRITSDGITSTDTLTALSVTAPSGIFSGIITATNVSVAQSVTANEYYGTFKGSIDPSVANDKISEGNSSAEVVDNGSDGHFKVITEGNEILRITSAGSIGVGMTDPEFKVDVKGNIRMFREYTNGALALHTNVDDATDVNINFKKARGAATPAVVQDNDDLGTINAQGYSGAASAFKTAARIHFEVDGEPDTSGDTSDMPGRILFETSPNGSANPEERVRITSGGMLIKGHTESAGQIETQLNSQNQFHGNDRKGGIRIADFSDSTFSANLEFVKSRNATIGQNTILQDGDIMGSIYWGGANGTNFQPGAFLSAITDGTVSSTSMPTAIIFGTNSGNNLGERLRIKPNGDLQFNSGFGSVQTAYGVRAWALWNGETNTLLDDGNIAGYTDEGVGTYTFTFDNNMPDGNYVITGSTGRNAKPHFSLGSNVRNASNFKVSTGTWGESYSALDVDSAMFCVIC